MLGVVCHLSVHAIAQIIPARHLRVCSRLLTQLS